MSEEESSGGLLQWILGVRGEIARFLLSLLVLSLLIVELLGLWELSLSWQAIALIVMLLFLFLKDEVRRLDVPNLGGVEFDRPAHSLQMLLRHQEEIEGSSKTKDPEEEEESETEEIEEETPIDPQQNYPSSISRYYSGKSVDEIYNEVYEAVQDNPRYAIIKLRSEIEGTARQLIQQRNLGPVLSDYKLIDTLAEADVLGEEVTNSYSEVRGWFNRIIHQEDANLDEILDAIDIGLDLLQYLKSASYDDQLRSRNVYWRGLDLMVRFPPDVSGDTFSIRKVNGSIGQLVTEFSLDESNEYVIHTRDLGVGEYVILSQRREPIKLLGDGALEEDVEIDEATFELAEQQLEAKFEPGLVTNEGGNVLSNLNISTNRGSFVLWIRCESIEADMLEQIFSENEGFIGAFNSVDADYVAFSYKARQNIKVNFERVPAEEYFFDLIVPDTNVRAGASISVNSL